nr:F-box protein PP2-B10-like [Quercus suber]
MVSLSQRNGFAELPEGCIANILSWTTPKDAGRACAFYPLFRAAADHHCPICDSLEFPFSETPLRLYPSLSDNPILIAGATESIFLDKLSGKKCYLLSARELSIIWGNGDTPQYWNWISLPEESRFPDVAELRFVWWFDISGRMSTSMLSPKTNYAAYLVFKRTDRAYGFDDPPPRASVGTTGGGEVHQQTVGLGLSVMEPKQQDRIEPPPQQHASRPKQREDGWLEIELGQFFTEGGENDELQIRLTEVEAGNVKTGLIVEGIEIMPTKGQDQ